LRDLTKEVWMRETIKEKMPNLEWLDELLRAGRKKGGKKEGGSKLLKMNFGKPSLEEE